MGLLKKNFVVLLTSTVNSSNSIKVVSLNNQECIIQSTLINLQLCNTLDKTYGKICVPNKTDDVNLSVFNMIAGINESEILICLYATNM